MLECAPGQIKDYKKRKSCFSEATLKKLAYAYNKHFSSPIANIKDKIYEQVRDELNSKLEYLCKSDSCRAVATGLDHDPDVNKELRPKTPEDWLDNPVTWLTNFNIEAVMYQYEDLYPDFKFLGVFPVDFSFRGEKQTCLNKTMCQLNLAELAKTHNYIGFIINLDTHEGPGTHWTAIFIDIQPKSKWFGMYYYDSTSNDPPTEIRKYYKLLKTTLSLKDRSKFKLIINRKRHQTGRTECGVFSMYFLIKWLTFIHKYPEKTDFVVIVNDDVIRDDTIVQLRKILFRPINEFKKAVT